MVALALCWSREDGISLFCTKFRKTLKRKCLGDEAQGRWCSSDIPPPSDSHSPGRIRRNFPQTGLMTLKETEFRHRGPSDKGNSAHGCAPLTPIVCNGAV